MQQPTNEQRPGKQRNERIRFASVYTRMRHQASFHSLRRVLDQHARTRTSVDLTQPCVKDVTDVKYVRDLATLFNEMEVVNHHGDVATIADAKTKCKKIFWRVHLFFGGRATSADLRAHWQTRTNRLSTQTDHKLNNPPINLGSIHDLNPFE